MKVYIETTNGEQLEFEVGTGSTIFEFKKMIIEQDLLESGDQIAFNNKKIKKEELTFEDIGIKNDSILTIRRKNAFAGIPKFLAKMTVPILATGLVFGAGHYLGVKFLRLFRHLAKHAELPKLV